MRVRSQSFLYDNIDPAKSAASDRKRNSREAPAEKQKVRRALENKDEQARLKELADEQLKARTQQKEKLQQAVLDKRLHRQDAARYEKALTYQDQTLEMPADGNYSGYYVDMEQ